MAVGSCAPWHLVLLPLLSTFFPSSSISPLSFSPSFPLFHLPLFSPFSPPHMSSTGLQGSPPRAFVKGKSKFDQANLGPLSLFTPLDMRGWQSRNACDPRHRRPANWAYQICFGGSCSVLCWGLSVVKGTPAVGRGACTFLVPGHSATWVTWVSAPRARARVQFPKAGGEHDGVMDPLSPTQAPLPGSLLVWAGTQTTLIRPVVRQAPPCHEGTRLKPYQLCNLERPLGFAALSPPQCPHCSRAVCGF